MTKHERQIGFILIAAGLLLAVLIYAGLLPTLPEDYRLAAVLLSLALVLLGFRKTVQISLKP